MNTKILIGDFSGMLKGCTFKTLLSLKIGVKDGKKYIDDNPDEKNIYTSKDMSIHTKGIAVYIEEMSAKWCPNGPNKIFNY